MGSFTSSTKINPKHRLSALLWEAAFTPHKSHLHSGGIISASCSKHRVRPSPWVGHRSNADFLPAPGLGNHTRCLPVPRLQVLGCWGSPVTTCSLGIRRQQWDNSLSPEKSGRSWGAKPGSTWSRHDTQKLGTARLGVVAHICHLSPWALEAGRAIVQAQPGLQNRFKASLD